LLPGLKVQALHAEKRSGNDGRGDGAGRGGYEAGAVGGDVVDGVRRGLVTSAAWADGSKGAIVPVPSQGQEAPMRKAIKYLLATAGMFVVVHSAMTVEARAQNIENGVGVVCDSPQQVERVIILRADFKSAVEEINAQNNSRVCEILNVAFLVGGIVAEASNDKGTWQIRKILIVGLYLGRIMNTVQPYQKYSAFLMSKAAPI
jgi:hypothetical protein